MDVEREVPIELSDSENPTKSSSINSAMDVVREAPTDGSDSENPTKSSSNRGGWITFPFFIGTMAALTVAETGWIRNLKTYLIQEYHMTPKHAAYVNNIFNGITVMFPIVGAMIADSFLGPFTVIWISSLISLLGTLIIFLTGTINQLRGSMKLNLQLVILYIGLMLGSLGISGTTYNISSMGANQFDSQKNQNIFFDWYTVAMYLPAVVITIAYFQFDLRWKVGFGISFAANMVGLVLFLAGSRFYRHSKPQKKGGTPTTKSPYADLARVVVASVRKRKLSLSENSDDYYNINPPTLLPSKSFRFLNRAALKRGTEGEINPNDGSIAKPWELCAVEQVEDFKGIIKMLPLWSTGLLLFIPIAIQQNLTTIQAETMARYHGRFSSLMPLSSMELFTFISTTVTVPILDRLLFPRWEKIFTARYTITPLKRIGIGYLISVLSMVVSAVVELRRIQVEKMRGEDENLSEKGMSVLWLLPSLIISGIGEAFHIPGSIGFYYQEFPNSLKSTSTAVVDLFARIGFYLSDPIMGLVRKTTNWLPETEDMNDGDKSIKEYRLDYLFWGCCVVGALNYVYFLVCASLYKYRNLQNLTDIHSHHPTTTTS